MLTTLTLAAGGSFVAARTAMFKKGKEIDLVAELARTKPIYVTPHTVDEPNFLSDSLQSIKNELQQVQTKAVTSLSKLEADYQQFVQLYIDPLLGKKRHAQLQEILSQADLTLSPEERFANLRLAFGMVTLGAALISQSVFPALMPAAIVLGLISMSNNFFFAWQYTKTSKQFGSIHLLCVYILFLWLGGYAAIGALGGVLLGVGLKIKAITENQSRNNLINIFQLQPGKVWVRSQDGAEIEIPFEQLQGGDTLILQAGQVVPVDGVVCAGVATIDQHMLTGEAQPVEKHLGDSVMAATVVLAGKIDVCVEKTGDQTTAGQIGVILNQTAQKQTLLALKIMEATDRFALPTLALSAVSLPFIGPAGAVSLMGANSTITTYMSSSISLLNFLNLAASVGVLVKDGGALEELSHIDTIVFDKTGTLTIEQPQVANIYCMSEISEDEVLRLAAAAEARQTHPIARAILATAHERQLSWPAVDQAQYEVGYGIKVRLMVDAEGVESSSPEREGEDGSLLVRVGSGRFMEMEGVQQPAQLETITSACQAQGHSLVMVALNEKLVGCIELQPTVRAEAKAVIDQLRQRGLAQYIISGDQDAPTRKLAQDLGMTGYFANTLPEQKADLVEKLQQEGHKVCFIGDGINDAIAMRKAQVSISLRGATSAATDTAQIILMEGNLKQLPQLLALSQGFNQNLRRNLRFTAGVSLFTMTGILLAGFTFAATEVFYTVSLLGGLIIAMKPLFDQPTQTNEAHKEVKIIDSTAS